MMRPIRNRLSDDRLLVSQGEAARLLSVSERTLYSMRKRGELNWVRIGPRVLYATEDLRHWIEHRKEGGLTDV